MYIDRIQQKLPASKYSLWYCNLMRLALDRTMHGNFELHHIAPRSFGLGGETDPSNLVKLSFREHFIAHKLLAKATEGTALRKKAIFAVYLMSSRHPKLSSRAYSRLRSDMSKSVEELWRDSDYRAKQHKATLTKYSSEAYKVKRSESSRKQHENPVTKAACVAALTKAHEKIDHSSEEWLSRSLHSEAGRAAALAATTSVEFRTICSARQLAKPVEDRQALAVKGAEALKASLGGEEAYRAYLSSRIRGRRKVVNLTSFEVKVVRKLPEEGWKYYTDLTYAEAQALAEAQHRRKAQNGLHH